MNVQEQPSGQYAFVVLPFPVQTHVSQIGEPFVREEFTPRFQDFIYNMVTSDEIDWSIGYPYVYEEKDMKMTSAVNVFPEIEPAHNVEGIESFITIEIVTTPDVDEEDADSLANTFDEDVLPVYNKVSDIEFLTTPEPQLWDESVMGSEQFIMDNKEMVMGLRKAPA